MLLLASFMRQISIFLLFPWLGNVIFLLHHVHVIWCRPSQMVQIRFSLVNSPGVLVSGRHREIVYKDTKPLAWWDGLVWSAESMLPSLGGSSHSCCVNTFTSHAGLFLFATSIPSVRDKLLEMVRSVSKIVHRFSC